MAVVQVNVLPEDFQPMVGMLEMVAFKKKMLGAEGDAWVEAVRSKFENIGVVTLRDFVRDVLVINRRLHNAGNSMLHQTTVSMMLREVCDMIFGPDAE
jgi:hypothetical protein